MTEVPEAEGRGAQVRVALLNGIHLRAPDQERTTIHHRSRR